MKLSRRFRLNKFLVSILFFIILHFLWKRNAVQTEVADPYVFDEKPLLNADEVKYYTSDELEPAFKRSSKQKSFPGEGGKPVILTSSGDGGNVV